MLSATCAFGAESGTIGAYTLTPEEGEVTEITTIKLNFPNTGIMGIDEPNTSGITLVSDAGKVYKVVSTNYTYETFAECYFAPEGESVPVTIKTPGTYTLTVPAGAFWKYNKPAITNDEITAVYTITGTGEPDEPEPTTDPFSGYTSTPADGENVGQFSLLTITFPAMPEGGLDWPIDASAITLTSADGNISLAGNSPMLSKLNTLIIGFSATDTQYIDHQTITEAGTYTVHIPAGTLSADGKPELKNEDIEISFTIDPMLNFCCKFSPDPSKVYSSLSEIKVLPDGAMKSIAPAEGGGAITLSSAEGEYTLIPSADGEGVALALAPDAMLNAGEWTLTIPAGALTALNESGLTIPNPEEITACYNIKEATRYTFTTSPEEGATLSILTKYTVDVEGKPKKVTVDTTAGTALLVNDKDEQFEMAAKVSGTSVMLAPKNGAVTTPGTYTVSIPEGYIVTTDADGLTAPLGAINTSFKITESAAADFNEGFLILNEGWFGHDASSLTHIPEAGLPTYRAFNLVNPERSLGITGGWITRYGDRIFTVAKQEGSNISGIQGGVVTAMDARNLAYSNELLKTPGGQPHALAAATADLGYLTTANGIFPINLNTLEAGEALDIVESGKLNCGEAVAYHGKVYVVAKSWDLIVIDPADNSFESVDCGPLAAPVITADGSLWFATLQEDKPFVRLDTETMTPEFLTIELPEEGTAKIATPWQTWRPSPLAADLSENVVYYATKDQATQIARLDLTTGEFNPAFITLPSTESGQQCLYGKGISIDPRTGEIVLNVTENGYGTHYLFNAIYRCDPVTGKILEDKTLPLSRDYWFPSMNIWCGYEAPVIELTDIEIPFGTNATTLDIAAATTLSLGNHALIDYSAETSEPAAVAIEETSAGTYKLTMLTDEPANVTVTASFMGLEASKTLTVTKESGVRKIEVSDGKMQDVYNAAGVLILRNASESEINSLAPGLYIIGGRKVMVTRR